MRQRATWASAVLLLLCGTLLISNIGTILAQKTDQPKSSEISPVITQVTSETRQVNPSTPLTSDLLTRMDLKAVSIVGPIDGDAGTWTLSEIENMEQAAEFLERQGVTVERFYTPNNGWTAITEAAKGAHFLLYRGHGVSQNAGASVGGFALKDRLVTPEDIVSDLELAPHAIVMLYACFSAGTAGDDGRDIGLQVAQRRVTQYSAPFLALGAGGYFANWFGDAFESYLVSLFDGATLGEAYEGFYDFDADTVFLDYHPDYPQQVMWLDKDDWRGYWEYNNAFVGMPDQTLETLFYQSDLAGIPGELSFVYSIPEAAFVVRESHRVTPNNALSGVPITWEVDWDADWLAISAVTGTTPDHSFHLTPTDFDRTAEGDYAGNVIVRDTVTAEEEMIAVTLQVTNHTFYRTYLPLVLR